MDESAVIIAQQVKMILFMILIFKLKEEATLLEKGVLSFPSQALP